VSYRERDKEREGKGIKTSRLSRSSRLILLLQTLTPIFVRERRGLTIARVFILFFFFCFLFPFASHGGLRG
jgi:hypothetical protein